MRTRNVLAWQICTGCANTRELLVTLAEARRLQALPIAEQEKHDGCYPHSGATNSRWLTNGARWAPSQTSTGVDDLPADRAVSPSAPSPAAPTDLTASAPDRAADVASQQDAAS